MSGKRANVCKTVFVTVGTTKFETLIDRLLDDDILAVLKKHSINRMIVQMGDGVHKRLVVDAGAERLDMVKNDVRVLAYKYKPSLKADLEAADLVISHAGAGSVIEALEANKKLIVVINETLMNNHQFELAEKMHQEGYLLYSLCSNLNEILEKMLSEEANLRAYEKGKPALFANYLNDYLKSKNL